MRGPNPVLLNHLFGFRIMNKAWSDLIAWSTHSELNLTGKNATQ